MMPKALGARFTTNNFQTAPLIVQVVQSVQRGGLCLHRERCKNVQWPLQSSADSEICVDLILLPVYLNQYHNRVVSESAARTPAAKRSLITLCTLTAPQSWYTHWYTEWCRQKPNRRLQHVRTTFNLKYHMWEASVKSYGLDVRMNIWCVSAHLRWPSLRLISFVGYYPNDNHLLEVCFSAHTHTRLHPTAALTASVFHTLSSRESDAFIF